MNFWVRIESIYYPTAEKVSTEIAAYRGSYLEQMDLRIPAAIELQTLLFLIENLWRVMAMMLIGMVLFRNGVLSNQKDKVFYEKMALFGILGGLAISAYGLFQAYQHEWEAVYQMCISHNYNYVASLLMALGCIGLVTLWSRSNFLKGLKDRMISVGRMAFTNYILTSVICTFIFYGHGLGYFAHFDRLGQYLIVILVWIILLLTSPFILKKWKQGPLEWLWRRFTYL